MPRPGPRSTSAGCRPTTSLADQPSIRSAPTLKNRITQSRSVPIIALSQLNRGSEQRPDKRPQVSDLRESGDIEQDADMVWFVYREDYYVAAKEPKRPSEGDNTKIFEDHAAWAADMERVYGLAELIVAKQRHGATGTVDLRFDRQFTKFSDLAPGGF